MRKEAMGKATGLLGFLVSGALCVSASSGVADIPNREAKVIYEQKVESIDGKPVSLSTYNGKVLLLVNTASECGYTPQYKDLEATYQKYKDRGLVVLGFPSNDFGGQEPGTNAEIKKFCEAKFKVSFPMFSKAAVKGSAKQPLYDFLTRTANPEIAGEVKWNFEKFLVDRKGRVVKRFDSKASPTGNEITKSIEALL